jgi:7-carboxy-7-deazaguanine synthase
MSQIVESIQNGRLPLMESFYTIQGEGYHSGKAAYFIRLGGCDVGCVWCDVKESWDANEHPLAEIGKIVAQANSSKSRISVITGGEPFMYDLTELTRQLKESGLHTHVETSGAYEITGTWDWICLSPKKFKKPVANALKAANELKVIVYNKSDFTWAEGMADKVEQGCKLYLQPEWSKSQEMLPGIIDYVKNNPHWEISLQVHKFMNIP